MTDAETPTRNSSTRKTLLDASIILGIVTALLFVLGHNYYDRYFAFFGISAAALDLPFYESIYFSLFPILAMSAGLLAFWFLVFLWRRAQRLDIGREFLRQFVEIFGFAQDKYIFGAYLVSVLMMLFMSVAQREGTKEAEKLYNNPQTRTFLSFKTVEHQTYDGELISINLDGGLRFLMQTKDLVVVFAKREYRPGRKLVFLVPMANLISVRNDALHLEAVKPKSSR